MLTCLHCGRRFPQAEVKGPVCPACGERELQLEIPVVTTEQDALKSTVKESKRCC